LSEHVFWISGLSDQKCVYDIWSCNVALYTFWLI
jgi:hypothetical protein